MRLLPIPQSKEDGTGGSNLVAHQNLGVATKDKEGKYEHNTYREREREIDCSELLLCMVKTHKLLSNDLLGEHNEIPWERYR